MRRVSFCRSFLTSIQDRYAAVCREVNLSRVACLNWSSLRRRMKLRVWRTQVAYSKPCWFSFFCEMRRSGESLIAFNLWSKATYWRIGI